VAVCRLSLKKNKQYMCCQDGLPVGASKSIIGGFTENFLDGETNYYWYKMRSDASEFFSNNGALMTTAATVKNLGIKLYTDPGTGKSVSVALFINGVASSLSVTINGGDPLTAYNNTDTAIYAVGDTICFGITTTAGTAGSEINIGAVMSI